MVVKRPMWSVCPSLSLLSQPLCLPSWLLCIFLYCFSETHTSVHSWTHSSSFPRLENSLSRVSLRKPSLASSLFPEVPVHEGLHWSFIQTNIQSKSHLRGTPHFRCPAPFFRCYTSLSKTQYDALCSNYRLPTLGASPEQELLYLSVSALPNEVKTVLYIR